MVSIPDASTPQSSDTSPDSDSTPYPGQSYDDLDELRTQIVATANSLVGIDYALGKSSPEEGFDNSGLIYYVLRENGYINCPRGTTAQLTMGTTISYDQAKPGDVMFFSDTYEGAEEENVFGGISVGDGQLVYSPYPGEKVKYANVTNSYWKDKFKCAISVS